MLRDALAASAAANATLVQAVGAKRKRDEASSEEMYAKAAKVRAGAEEAAAKLKEDAEVEAAEIRRTARAERAALEAEARAVRPGDIIARHVIRCHFTQETKVQSASDDSVSHIHQEP